MAVDVRAFLQKYAAVNESDAARLQAGQTVAKLLNTSQKREVAALGIVRINVSLDFFMDHFRDIVHFKEGPSVSQIEKFGNPPTAESLNRLTLDGIDIKALTKCKAGSCPIKASVEMMQRFRREAGSTFASKSSANSLLRDILSGYVSDYVNRGNAVLISYADKKDVVRLQEEFLSLLAEFPFLAEYAQPLAQELAGFPQFDSPEVQDFLYWSKEAYGPRPVMSITHTMLYPVPSQSSRWCFIASKQIYASHYFEGSLGTAVVAEGTIDSAQPYVWAIYLNRSRVDALRGWFISLKRYILVSRVRDGMAQNLKLLKTRLEERYRQEGGRIPASSGMRE